MLRWKASLKPASAVSNILIDEKFEGSGTPSGWSTYIGSGGTIDFQNTTYVLEGSQNLRVTSNNYTNTSYNLGQEYGHVVLTLARRATSLSNRKDVFLYNSASNRGSNINSMQYGAVSSSTNGIQHDSIKTTLTGSINTNHYIRIEIDVSNDIVKIARSNDGTSFPTSGTNYNERSNFINAAFGGVQYIALGASNKNATQYYDDVLLIDASV